MAQVIPNDDGTFSAVVGDTDVTEITDYEEAQEILDKHEEEGSLDDEEIVPEDESVSSESSDDTLDSLEDASFSDEEANNVPLEMDEPVLYSSVPSSSVFTPLPWQVNLAQNRQLGEHYLMYGVRRTSGSSYYWQYYLVLGHDIEYADNVYTFTDCDLYTYYSYGSVVTYEYLKQSGSVAGNSALVYSDLYFDYIGNDSLANSWPYLSFVLLLVIILLFIVGGRRRV